MQEKKYAAFISYSHADKAWARWLHRSIESYVVPAWLRGVETPLGVLQKKLGKVFLDEAELGSSSDLSGALEEALASSAALIVVCSPQSAISERVAEEIRSFEKLHGRDRIFCLIADGRPMVVSRGLDPALECFSPPLLDGKEPLAADGRGARSSRQEARDRLLAGILEVGFDELRRRELARRNRRLLLTTAVSSVIAVGATALTFAAVSARNEADTQRQLAATEAARTERILEFVLGSFQAADPYKTNGLEVTAEEILKRSRDRLDNDLETEPEIQRTMRNSMALVYFRLGDYETSANLLRANMREIDPITNARDYYDANGKLAISLIEMGEYKEAEQLLRDELGYYRSGEHSRSVLADTLNDLGRLLKDQAKFDESESMLREAITLYEEAGADPEALMVGYNNLSIVLRQLGRIEESRKFADLTIELRTELFGADHPYTARAENNLGTLLYSQGKLDEAKVYHERALAKRRAAFGDDHAEVAESTYNLGLVHLDLKDLARASRLINTALELDRNALGDEHPAVAYDYFALARIQAAAGEWPAVGPLLSKATVIRDARLAPNHQLSRGTLMFEVAYNYTQGNFDLAIEQSAILQSVYEDLERTDHPNWQMAEGIKVLSSAPFPDTNSLKPADMQRLRASIDAVETSGEKYEEALLLILTEVCDATSC